MDALQQQMDEFECVLSMFPDHEELHYDHQLKEQYKSYLSMPHTAAGSPKSRFEYTILFKNLDNADSYVSELEIKYPPLYPLAAHVEFVVHCSWLARDQMERLQTELLCIATGNDGELVVLQLYQCMVDLLAEAAKATAKTQTKNEGTTDNLLIQPNLSTSQPQQLLLGRRAIYFHHIIASTKRRVIKEWALELQLGGFSKIGWPGVVIVEGLETNAQEYVRRLQRLRWKQMVVRGEQTESLICTNSSSTIDAQRRLPRGFCEFPESAMSEVAALCRAAGLEELFLTVMKIYRPVPGEEDNGGSGSSSVAKNKTSKRAMKNHI